jgi:hypothetical protein
MKRSWAEAQVRLGRVHEAAAKLQDRHVTWILDAAVEYFVERAHETENEILRNQALPAYPVFTRYGKDRGRDGGGATREGELPKSRARLGEYYAVLEFLHALKDAEVLRSAEAFARGLVTSGFFAEARAARRSGRGGT